MQIQTNIYDEYDLPVENEKTSETFKCVLKKNLSLKSLDTNDFAQVQLHRDSIKPASSFSIPEIQVKDFSQLGESCKPRAKMRADDILNATNLDSSNQQSLENIRKSSFTDSSIVSVNENFGRKKIVKLVGDSCLLVVINFFIRKYSFSSNYYRETLNNRI